MFKPEPDHDALVARLTSLERRQRLLQLLAGAGALLVPAALAAFAAEDPDIVQARRVELIDLKGETRATLAADTAGVNLTLFDQRGRFTAAIRLNGDPRLTVLDQAGREVAGIGAPRVQHLVE